jgi:hypothetical protein
MVTDMKKILVFAGVAFVSGAAGRAVRSRSGDFRRGVFVQGWTGKIDAGSTRQGGAERRQVRAGWQRPPSRPARRPRWNWANTASGDYP